MHHDDVAWWIGKGKATRVDVTADFPGLDLRPVEIREMIRRGELVTSVESMRLVDAEGGKTDGQTLYLGSRESPRMVRIYEKGRQLGNEDAMLRVEVELKEHLASTCFEACVPQPAGYQDWVGGQWRSHLERVVSGKLVSAWAAELPRAELRTDVDDLDPWRTLAALRAQYGPILSEMHRMGLLMDFVENLNDRSALSQRRAARKVRELAQDVDRVISVAQGLGV